MRPKAAKNSVSSSLSGTGHFAATVGTNRHESKVTHGFPVSVLVMQL